MQTRKIREEAVAEPRSETLRKNEEEETSKARRPRKGARGEGCLSERPSHHHPLYTEALRPEGV
jgi:hypothetical protein